MKKILAMLLVLLFVVTSLTAAAPPPEGEKAIFIDPRIEEKLAENGTVNIFVSLKIPGGWEPEPRLARREYRISTNSLVSRNQIKTSKLVSAQRENIAQAKAEFTAQGFQKYISFASKYTNQLELRGVDAETFEKIVAYEGVEAVLLVEEMKLILDDSLVSLGLLTEISESDFWSGTSPYLTPNWANIQPHRTVSYDGTGTTVVVIDSGVNPDDPFFQGKVRAFDCYYRNGSESCIEEPSLGRPCQYDDYLCSHGSHIMGIIHAINPNGNKISMKAGDIDPVDIVVAIDTTYELWLDGENIVAVNCSWGGGNYTAPIGPDDPNWWFYVGRLNLIENGVIFVAGSGNDGYVDAIYHPAALTDVISVGATRNDATRSITSFSNVAWFLDFVAPGMGIVSVGSEIGTVCSKNGTSMSTPHIVGLIALIKQKYPNATLEEIRAHLKRGAIQVGGEDFAYQYEYPEGSGNMYSFDGYFDFPNPLAIFIDGYETPTPTPTPTATPSAVEPLIFEGGGFYPLPWPIGSSGSVCYGVNNPNNNEVSTGLYIFSTTPPWMNINRAWIPPGDSCFEFEINTAMAAEVGEYEGEVVLFERIEWNNGSSWVGDLQTVPYRVSFVSDATPTPTPNNATSTRTPTLAPLTPSATATPSRTPTLAPPTATATPTPAWRQYPGAPTGSDLRVVVMLSPSAGWSVGDNGTILRYTAGTWSAVAAPTTAHLYGIAMLDDHTGWIVGAAGTVLRWQGSAWELIPAFTTADLYSVSAVSADEVWAVGANGELWHYSSSSWTAVSGDTTAALYGVSMARSNAGWAVGAYGALLAPLADLMSLRLYLPLLMKNYTAPAYP